MAIEDVQTNLRIPSNLKEQLQASADAAGRSLSAEAAHRLAISYELEKVTNDLHGAVASLQSQYDAARNHADRVSVKLRNTEREVARLEERLETLKSARTSDIAAATANLEQRLEFLAEKAAFAQREAESVREAHRALARLVKVIGDYLAIVAEMVEKSTPEGRHLMRLIQTIGESLRDEDFAAAVAAARDIGNLSQEHKLRALLDKPDAQVPPAKRKRQVKGRKSGE